MKKLTKPQAAILKWMAENPAENVISVTTFVKYRETFITRFYQHRNRAVMAKTFQALTPYLILKYRDERELMQSYTWAVDPARVAGKLEK